MWLEALKSFSFSVKMTLEKFGSEFVLCGNFKHEVNIKK
jgi:hypothetical protein